jgi:hypothetical protein
MTQKDNRGESKEKRKGKKEKKKISKIHRNSEDDSLNTVKKILMRRIYRHHEKLTLEPVMRC